MILFQIMNSGVVVGAIWGRHSTEALCNYLAHAFIAEPSYVMAEEMVPEGQVMGWHDTP